ncbi:MAG: helix-turn-helix domain-containing protein [Saprospirales bacterium]|nr:helix-turn-helix domain-containing protein [Saprospirales bacterium]
MVRVFFLSILLFIETKSFIFDKYCQEIFFQMNKFGASIREKRQARGMLLRQLSAALEIDAAILSKIERGERNAKREHPLLGRALTSMRKNCLPCGWATRCMKW